MVPTEPGSLQDQIAEIRDLAEENNKLLKAMRRDAIIGGILKTVIWAAFILGSLYLSMKFLEPYLSMLSGLQGENAPDFQALFEQYKEQFGQ